MEKTDKEYEEEQDQAKTENKYISKQYNIFTTTTVI